MAKRYLSSKPRVVALQEPPELTSAVPRPHPSCPQRKARSPANRAGPQAPGAGRANSRPCRSRLTKWRAAPPLPQRVDRRVAEPDDGHGRGAPRVLRHAERCRSPRVSAQRPARRAACPGGAGRNGTGHGTALGLVTVSAACPRSVRLNINQPSGGQVLLESPPDAKKRGKVLLREKSSRQIREQPAYLKRG